MHSLVPDLPLPDWILAPHPILGTPQELKTGKQYFDAVLAAMERHNIVTGFVSGIDSEDFVSAGQWNAAATGRFVVGRRFNGAPLPTVEELRSEFNGRKFSYLGELGLQYVGLTLNDPMFDPILSLAEELDIPVGVHMGLGPPDISYGPRPKFRATLGNPLLIEDALVRHPKLRIWIMHAGYPFLEETKALLHTYTNVYVDISAIDWLQALDDFHHYLAGLVQADLTDRIMFGSDVFGWPTAIDTAVEAVESANFLTRQQKRDIFYNNAMKFFRLNASAG